MKLGKWLLSLMIPFSLLSWTLPEVEIDPELIKQAEEEEKAYNTYIGDLNDFRSRFAEEMKEELGLACAGNNGRVYGAIEELGMDFYAKRRATIEEARALHLLIMERFIKAINACEKIRPFMKPYPFTYKNITISIIFTGINGRHADGTIARISNVSDSANPPNQNCIFYKRWDPFNFDSERLLVETREEAIERNQAAAIANPAAHQATEKEKAIDDFLYTFREDMARKYRLDCWSVGGKMAENIEEVGAHFVVFHRASEEEARALILKVIDHLIRALNKNEALKPYLAETPFPVDRLKLYLGFRNKRSTTYRDGSMESVTLEGNKVSYFQETPVEKEGELPEFIEIDVPLYKTESYKEAVTAFEKTPKPGLHKKLLSKLLNFTSH